MTEDEQGKHDEQEELTDIGELLDERKAVTTTHRKQKERELTDLESMIQDHGSDTHVSGRTRSEILDNSTGSASFGDELDPEKREKWSKTLVLTGYALVGGGLILMLVLPQTPTLISALLMAGVLCLGISFLL
jgi:hypothetical protein